MNVSEPSVSIILPAYNEEANLSELYRRLNESTSELSDYEFEFLLVDNCSSDATPSLARDFVDRDPRWRFVRFSRNFGAEVSLAAGLHYAQGDAVIFMATDLQDPPELIPLMISKWREGF